MNSKGRQSGFTLIEVMAVVVILGLLVTLVVPKVLGKQEQAQIQKAKIDIQILSGALTMYKLDNFNFPSTSQGLESLVNKPSGAPEAKNWRSGYVNRLPKDPWGNEYLYLSPGNNSQDYDIWSHGSDGKKGGTGTAQDIGNWEASELTGHKDDWNLSK